MCTGRGSNQGPLGPKSDALTTAPLPHLHNLMSWIENELLHEKTSFFAEASNKGTDQLHSRSVALIFVAYLVSKSKISGASLHMQFVSQ